MYGVRAENSSLSGSTFITTRFVCCPDCCRAGPSACGHVNATFRCAGRLCVPPCPAPSALPGLLGCPCSTNVSLPNSERCAGDYVCDSTAQGVCSSTRPPSIGSSCIVTSDIDSCAQRNGSYHCVSSLGGRFECRECPVGISSCRCDDRRACVSRLCVDGRCGLLGCRGCTCGRWRTCAAGLVCNDLQICETAPNSTEVCTGLSDTAAQQCDYATQELDIDDLFRSAPLDEGLPVQPSPSIAPMCAKLRQVLICRARVFDSSTNSTSGCVDTGIGATVARVCEAIPAARLAALNCGICEPETCDAAKPACLRGLACIGGECVIDPQFAICRNASTLLYASCPDTAKQQDIETVQLAAKVGAMTNATDTAACSARKPQRLLCARVWRCRLRTAPALAVPISVRSIR